MIRRREEERAQLGTMDEELSVMDTCQRILLQIDQEKKIVSASCSDLFQERFYTCTYARLLMLSPQTRNKPKKAGRLLSDQAQ
jgi:hypothetical protein